MFKYVGHSSELIRVCWGKMFKLILLSSLYSYCSPQTVTETKFRKITSDLKESFFFISWIKTDICSWAMFRQRKYYHSLSVGCFLHIQKCKWSSRNFLDINGEPSRSSAFSHNNQTNECSLYQVFFQIKSKFIVHR